MHLCLCLCLCQCACLSAKTINFVFRQHFHAIFFSLLFTNISIVQSASFSLGLFCFFLFVFGYCFLVLGRGRGGGELGPVFAPFGAKPLLHQRPGLAGRKVFGQRNQNTDWPEKFESRAEAGSSNWVICATRPPAGKQQLTASRRRKAESSPATLPLLPPCHLTTLPPCRVAEEVVPATLKSLKSALN